MTEFVTDAWSLLDISHNLTGSGIGIPLGALELMAKAETVQDFYRAIVDFTVADQMP